MIRTPLRPLARVIRAREAGENPDVIERENIRARIEAMRDASRARAEGRLLLLGLMFFTAFGVVGARMGVLASSEPREPRAAVSTTSILSQRADIMDRQGRILATNIGTYSLYAQPGLMIDRPRAARELAAVFPDLAAGDLLARFQGKRKFLWIKRKLSPEQMQAVHDIGEPGLLFGPREMRLYPNGRLAAHILGGASFGREGVHSAEVIGMAGVEKTFDDYLRDPGNGGKPLTLSIDLGVQATTERVLAGGMGLMRARAAGAVLMHAKTGEVIAMVSLPDFDPNDPPRGSWTGAAEDDPVFNRMVQGVYELGSVFKTFTIAQALDSGLVSPATMIDTSGPLKWGKYRIRDFHNYGKRLSVSDVVVKSSNIGAARIAMQIGPEAHREFLGALGFLQPVDLELSEAASGRPIVPKNWSEISTMTISYGHGLSVSPLQLAAGYATILGGGQRIAPTLLPQAGPQAGNRVVSEHTSAHLRVMLREVVTDGTATLGNVQGYTVAGKTGTADKPDLKNGGYHQDRVIATFASAFPAHDPAYVLVVMLDEPVETSGFEPRRTAGWTAVPVAAEIIRRVAPLLGLRPAIEQGQMIAVTLKTN